MSLRAWIDWIFENPYAAAHVLYAIFYYCILFAAVLFLLFTCCRGLLRRLCRPRAEGFLVSSSAEQSSQSQSLGDEEMQVFSSNLPPNNDSGTWAESELSGPSHEIQSENLPTTEVQTAGPSTSMETGENTQSVWQQVRQSVTQTTTVSLISPRKSLRLAQKVSEDSAESSTENSGEPQPASSSEPPESQQNTPTHHPPDERRKSARLQKMNSKEKDE